MLKEKISDIKEVLNKKIENDFTIESNSIKDTFKKMFNNIINNFDINYSISTVYDKKINKVLSLEIHQNDFLAVYVLKIENDNNISILSIDDIFIIE